VKLKTYCKGGMIMAQVLVIEGSRTDDKNTNILLKILCECNVDYRVDCASAHWYAGLIYADYIKKIKEKIIIFIGGMSPSAPGIISAILRNLNKHDTIVIGIPADKAARSAIEDLPMGTPVLMPGFNTTSVKHSIINGGLTAAKLALAQSNNELIRDGLSDWFLNKHRKKPIERIVLNDKGLIP